jgi:hypothetical protein
VDPPRINVEGDQVRIQAEIHCDALQAAGDAAVLS